MNHYGVLVHCPRRLGPAATVLAAEISCGDGVSTKQALESATTVHHFDGVMSHNFNSRRLSRHDPELKDSMMSSWGRNGTLRQSDLGDWSDPAFEKDVGQPPNGSRMAALPQESATGHTVHSGEAEAAPSTFTLPLDCPTLTSK